MEGDLPMGRVLDASNQHDDYRLAHLCLHSLKLIHLFYEDLRQGSVCVFPKGENWQNELDLAQNNWLLKYSVETSITNKGSKIFIIKGVKRRNE